MHPLSFSLKRKTESYNWSKTIEKSTLSLYITNTHSLSSQTSFKIWAMPTYIWNLMFIGGTIMFESGKEMKIKQPSRCDMASMNPWLCTLALQTCQPHFKWWWTISTKMSYWNMNHKAQQSAYTWTTSGLQHVPIWKHILPWWAMFFASQKTTNCTLNQRSAHSMHHPWITWG